MREGPTVAGGSSDDVLTCDICGTTVNVAAYTIVTPDGAHIIDLCPGDAKPLLKLYDKGSDKPRRKRNGPQGHAVIPVD